MSEPVWIQSNHLQLARQGVHLVRMAPTQHQSDYIPLYTAPQPPADVPRLTNEELLGAIARGWCHEANEHKTMDSHLALAIAEEVRDLVEAEVRRRCGVVG